MVLQFTYKTRGIVVTNCFSISPRLQYRVRLDNLVLQVCLLLSILGGTTRSGDVGEVLDDFLCIFSFTSSRLTTKQNKNIILPVAQPGEGGLREL